jgi:hypothetical protein
MDPTPAAKPAPDDVSSQVWHVPDGLGVALVALFAIVWCWFFSVPGGAAVPIAAAMLLAFLLATCVAVGSLARWTVDAWQRWRRGETVRPIPISSLAVGAIVVLVVIGSRGDVAVRLRFEQQRHHFVELVDLISTNLPSDPVAALSFSAEVPGYGRVAVVDVPGGFFVMTPSGGDSPELGFVYLPSDSDHLVYLASPNARNLRSLGDGWYVTAS